MSVIKVHKYISLRINLFIDWLLIKTKCEEFYIFACPSSIVRFHQREHKVRDVIGFMDGLCLNTECTSEPLEQNSIYSGYHSDTMINDQKCVCKYGSFIII